MIELAAGDFISFFLRLIYMYVSRTSISANVLSTLSVALHRYSNPLTTPPKLLSAS